VKTVNGKMVGKKDLQFPRIKDTGCWFGLHLIDWSRPVMLVEGELDALRLKTLGFTNVVASTGWHIQESQAVQVVSPQIIVGLDADKAGIKGAFRSEKLFRSKTNLVFADWSMVGCKDAGELRGKKSLRKVLLNLKRSPKELKEIDKRTTV
jgi:DNA primase